jgi:outer membrane immunogenic protein
MRLFAASLLLSAFATPAFAQDNADRPFEGASITAITGIDGTNQFDAKGTGVLYGAQAGYDIQRGKLVLGVEGEVAGSTAKACTTYTAGSSYCTKADRDLYVGGKLGVAVGNSTLLYAKAGYTNYRDKFSFADPATPANNYRGSGVMDGIRGGVGVEQKVGANVSVKAEYRYSNYESDYSRNQGVVGVGFHF